MISTISAATAAFEMLTVAHYRPDAERTYLSLLRSQPGRFFVLRRSFTAPPISSRTGAFAAGNPGLDIFGPPANSPAAQPDRRRKSANGNIGIDAGAAFSGRLLDRRKSENSNNVHWVSLAVKSSQDVLGRACGANALIPQNYYFPAAAHQSRRVVSLTESRGHRSVSSVHPII